MKPKASHFAFRAAWGVLLALSATVALNACASDEPMTFEQQLREREEERYERYSNRTDERLLDDRHDRSSTGNAPVNEKP